MKELVPSLKTTLFEPTYELAFEYAEIGIDALFNNEAPKSIPFLNTVAAI